MSETITTYQINDLSQALPMERSEFYSSQIQLLKNGQKPNKSVEIVQILMFTPEAELILQKRSNDKSHNPGLIDKTIGGHVTFGDTPNYTAMVETLQEMQIPSIVLSSSEDFLKTYKLLRNFLNNSALLQLIDKRTDNFSKLINGEVVPIANSYHLYLGVYGGSVKPADREASGILFYKLDVLYADMAKAPQLFTEDLKFFLNYYKDQISDFLKNFQ